MRTMLYLEIDPTILVDLLRAFTSHCEVLAIRAGQDARAIGTSAGMADEAAIRTYLIARGLTPRQCDLVVLDIQGHSRADIIAVCGVSAATVKKYWGEIYRRLGVASRQMLRLRVRADCGFSATQPLLVRAIGQPDYRLNYPRAGDYPAQRPVSILDDRSIDRTNHK